MKSDRQEKQFQDNVVRQRTLTELRWVAIIGQLATVLIALWLINLNFNHFMVLVCIGLWTMVNLVQQTLTAASLRVSSNFLFLALFVDLIELSAVLYFTGGINNPFIVLLSVPAALGATILNLPALCVLVFVSLSSVLILAFLYESVYFAGSAISIPKLVGEGMLIALVVLTLFMTSFLWRLSQERHKMTQALAASELALQREHRLSALGALVSAYAHELGTPLATIRLAASDLLTHDLDHDAKNDAEEILREAKRSAMILQSMGRRGKEDEMMKTVLFSELIEEAASPHLKRGKGVDIRANLEDLLYVERSEAIIQGLRNIIQNAVDFAKSEVIITLAQERGRLILRVLDDGEGFPSELIGRLGEPYLKTTAGEKRANYRGMGLGVFIAKTLLERSGAQVQFANRPSKQGTGAVVQMLWSRADLEVPKDVVMRAMGENQEFAT